MVDDRLWIWHLIFGYPGSMNELRLNERSSQFSDVKVGTCHFAATEGKDRRKGYRLVLSGSLWHLLSLPNLSENDSLSFNKV